MASLSSERNAAIPSYAIEEMFDLDMVLSLPEDYSHCTSSEQAPTTLPEFPTVKSSEVCPVCLDHFQKDEGGKQIPCGHVYHSACISRWFSRGNSCPMCRRQISGEGSPATLKE